MDKEDEGGSEDVVCLLNDSNMADKDWAVDTSKSLFQGPHTVGKKGRVVGVKRAKMWEIIDLYYYLCLNQRSQLMRPVLTNIVGGG